MMLSSVDQPENSSEAFQWETRKEGGGRRTHREINHKAAFFEMLPSEFSSEDIFPACLPLNFAVQFLNTAELYVQFAVNTPDGTFKCNKLLHTKSAWPQDRIKASSNVCIKRKKSLRLLTCASAPSWACFHSWQAEGSIVSQYLER